MAEGRMLKRVITTSPHLAALKNDTHRLIYTWIIPFLDVEGRLEADPRIIKGSIAPLLDHITTKTIESALNDLAINDLIILYSVNGNKYLQLQRFNKHQNLRKDREKESDIPSPDRDDSRITPGQVPEDSRSTPTEVKLREVKLREEKDAGRVPDFISLETWNDFVQHRRSKRSPLTPKAQELIFRKLSKWKNKNGWDPNEVLNQSIENGWTGIFELKEKKFKPEEHPLKIPESKTEPLPDLTPEQREVNKRKMHELFEKVGGKSA